MASERTARFDILLVLNASCPALVLLCSLFRTPRASASRHSDLEHFVSLAW